MALNSRQAYALAKVQSAESTKVRKAKPKKQARR